MYDPMRLLRELKGAPLAVLVAFSIMRSTLSAEFLVMQTGYTDKPVTMALKLLTSRGWLSKCMGGWRIADGAQLPLGLSESEKFRLSSSSSSDSNSTSYLQEQEEDRKNSDSFHANYRTLKGYGIREPACTRLSNLPHVTPEFINAHVRQVQIEKGYLGTAIHRIENDWPVTEIVELKPAQVRYTGSVWDELLNRREESEEE